MDILTFISKLFEYCSWPATTFGIFYLFRSQLKELIPSIRKLKAGPVEVELERVVKELEKAKQVAAAADAKATVVAAKFDEDDDNLDFVPEESMPHKLERGKVPLLSKIESLVLEKMVNSRFITRSVSGVAAESKLSTAVVRTTYGSLVSKGLVEPTTNVDGAPRWFVTALGRTISNEI
jgi:exonuclease VII small subunit